MEITNSILFSNLHTPFLSPPHSLPSHLPYSPPKFPSLHSTHLRISNSTLSLSHPFKSPLHPSLKHTFKPHCSAEAVAVTAVEEISEDTQDGNLKKKLYVVNLPWSFSSDDLKTAFSECGTVTEVEVIRDKAGKNRGFAFVSMDTADEAQAAIDKFHLQEMGGRTIKVEFAKRLKKPRPPPPADLPVQETRHKLYISNLQWKARTSHLREFFSANFKPVSARVVFETPNGRSAGYGFVSFSTREEAEAAISSLDGKELLGRPVRLKFSERPGEGEAEKEEPEKAIPDDSESPLHEEEQKQEKDSQAELEKS